jgi:hypothetical protein
VSLLEYFRFLWDVVDTVQSCVWLHDIVASPGGSFPHVHGRKSRPIVADVITADQLHGVRRTSDCSRGSALTCISIGYWRGLSVTNPPLVPTKPFRKAKRAAVAFIVQTITGDESCGRATSAGPSAVTKYKNITQETFSRFSKDDYQESMAVRENRKCDSKQPGERAWTRQELLALVCVARRGKDWWWELSRELRTHGLVAVTGVWQHGLQGPIRGPAPPRDSNTGPA